MSSAFDNPFDAVRDADRHEIWELLVARDCDGFMAQDWGMVADDFADDRFDGIVANGSNDPWDWSLKYPTVESYRDHWLRLAVEYLKLPLVEDDHRDLLYRMTTLERVEIHGDRAAVWKCFSADEPLQNGDRFRVSAQSIYRLHRIGGVWKIVGFVGYLPRETPAGHRPR